MFRSFLRVVSEFDTHHLTNQVPHHPKLPTSYQVPCIMSCYVTSISCTYCHFAVVYLFFLFCYCLILLNIVLLFTSIKLVTSTLCTLYFLDQWFRYSSAYQFVLVSDHTVSVLNKSKIKITIFN